MTTTEAQREFHRRMAIIRQRAAARELRRTGPRTRAQQDEHTRVEDEAAARTAERLRIYDLETGRTSLDWSDYTTKGWAARLDELIRSRYAEE